MEARWLKVRILGRLATAEPTVSLRLKEIVGAAHVGRVDGLLTADNALLWGRFDPTTGSMTSHGTSSGGDEDLLNEAVVHTLDHGGSAFSLPQPEMPRGALAAEEQTGLCRSEPDDPLCPGRRGSATWLSWTSRSWIGIKVVREADLKLSHVMVRG
jgi:hypothetical protein